MDQAAFRTQKLREANDHTRAAALPRPGERSPIFLFG